MLVIQVEPEPFDAASVVSPATWPTRSIEIVVGIVSVFTAGAAEAPTQGVEAGRIAATAAKIAEFIRTLIAAVEELLDAIGSALSRIGDVADNLKVILGARLSEVATSLAARLPLIGKDAERPRSTACRHGRKAGLIVALTSRNSSAATCPRSSRRSTGLPMVMPKASRAST